MKIGELARKTGASVRSLRYYEAAGLLPAARRPNGYREFDASAVERVVAIRGLLETGFTLDEVGLLSACLTAAGDDTCCCSRTVALYRSRLARIDQQLATLALLRGRIQERIAALEPC